MMRYFRRFMSKFRLAMAKVNLGWKKLYILQQAIRSLTICYLKSGLAQLKIAYLHVFLAMEINQIKMLCIGIEDKSFDLEEQWQLELG